MLGGQPMHGCLRLTRRELFATLIGVPIMGTTVPTLGMQTGFQVRGQLTATEQEDQEAYYAIGKEFALVTKPKSPVHQKLSELRGLEVYVHVEPIE